MAPIQTSEILDMPNIRALAKRVAERSALVNNAFHNNGIQNGVDVTEKAVPEIVEEEHELEYCCENKEHRKFPLLPLEKLFEYYLDGVRHLVSDEEYLSALKAAKEFQRPGGLGQQLYAQLVDRSNDPTRGNWMSDIYADSLYLQRRRTIAPHSNMMGCIASLDVPHSQAERAAIISLTAFKFKLALEANDVPPDYLNELPLCMDLRKYLFNATREPCQHRDRVLKFHGQEYDYLVVLRRGRVFKINLRDGESVVSNDKLRASFQAIIDLELDECRVGALTAGTRDSWAAVSHYQKTLHNFENTVKSVN